MKKSLAFLLCFCFVCSLVACGSNTPSATDPTQSISSSPMPTDTAPATSQTTPINDNDISFTEQVLIDNEHCTVKVTGIDPDGFWGYTLSTYLENKSQETTYMFSVDSASINGVQSDPFFATEVAAGKKSNTEISFSDSALKTIGITKFTDIELSLRVYDSNDWSADPVAEETVHIYPYGEENVIRYVRESQASDTILTDNEYATIIVTDYDNDGLWGYTVNLYIENKSDTHIMVSTDNVSVNGYMVDPFFATTVASGKCAFTSISWSDSDFEANDITTVEEIEFALRVYDAENWLADDMVNEVIVLTP